MVPYQQLRPREEIGSGELRNSPISSMIPTYKPTSGNLLHEWDDILHSPAIRCSQEDLRAFGNACDDGPV